MTDEMPPYAGDEPPRNSLGEVEPPIPHDPGDPPAEHPASDR